MLLKQQEAQKMLKRKNTTDLEKKVYQTIIDNQNAAAQAIREKLICVNQLEY